MQRDQGWTLEKRLRRGETEHLLAGEQVRPVVDVLEEVPQPGDRPALLGRCLLAPLALPRFLPKLHLL